MQIKYVAYVLRDAATLNIKRRLLSWIYGYPS